MLIWNAHGTHLVLVFKQLLEDFAESILEMFSLKVSNNCQWRCYRCAEIRHSEERSKLRYPHMLKSYSHDTNVCSWPDLKIFGEVNMNSEEIHTEGITSLLCGIHPGCLGLHAGYCRKNISLLFVSFSFSTSI